MDEKVHKWDVAHVQFSCHSSDVCKLWVDSLHSIVKKKNSGIRPKNLLVFVNPLGGKGAGIRVYEKLVAPLFRLASIHADVIGKF